MVTLPGWASLLAVIAHPDDESFGLGAVISSFADQGSTVSVLCMSHGEASTLHGVAGHLYGIREAELAAAAEVLGVSSVSLRDYPDGHLADIAAEELAAAVRELANQSGANGLLVFDLSGVTGHVDHRHTTRAALIAATAAATPVLGWTLPAEVAATLNTEYGASFAGHHLADIDIVVPVDRRRQYDAIDRHRSQALPKSVLWRRLELLGSYEYLRWLAT